MLKIHVNHNGKTEGPYPFEVIQEKILNGELSSNDWVWWKGQKEWSSIRDLPGLELPQEDTSAAKSDEPSSTTAKSASEEPSAEPSTFKRPESSQSNKSDDDGLTVPDFRVEFILWITAGWYCLRSFFKNSRNGNFRLVSVSFLPVILLLGVVIFFRHSMTIITVCSIFLPVLMAPLNWVIMEQFRLNRRTLVELAAVYSRAPIALFLLGVINQIPTLVIAPLCQPFLSEKTLNTVVSVTALLMSFLLFYSVNLLVDKRVSLLNALAFSIQAVNRQFFPMLAYVLLTGAIAISGVLLFQVGIIFTIIIAYTSTVFAYLWVFSRDTLPIREDSENQGK